MLPGASGALVQMNGVPSGGNSTIIYFVSNDCSVEESRVESAGGKVFKPKMSIGEYGFMSLVTDTEGNMVGFHSLKYLNKSKQHFLFAFLFFLEIKAFLRLLFY